MNREEHGRSFGVGEKVELQNLDAEGILDVQKLLAHYCKDLSETEQEAKAKEVEKIASTPSQNFLMSDPIQEQTDPSISTE